MFKNVIFKLFLLFFPIYTLCAANWYVDKSVNGNGTSWGSAWNDFGDIVWSSINPGDTLYISGGSTNNYKTYTDRLSIVNVRGKSGLPITIKIDESNSSHNGTVRITNTGNYGGIFLQNSSYITINGNVSGNQKIRVYNCSNAGIDIYSGYGEYSHHLILTYLEIDHNGDARDEHGILIRYNGELYPIVEISHCKIHDNYQDQINAGGSSTNFVSTFGCFLIHHNEIYNINDDGFECYTGGVDFYNNNIHSRIATGGTGHPDAIQFYGEYYRIYNNTFHDFNYNTSDPDLLSNAYIYIHTGTSTGDKRPAKEIYIYNNLIYESSIITGNSVLRGIAFNPIEDTTFSISNILIANNTIINMPCQGIILNFRNLENAVDNVIVVNNIIYNCYTVSPGQVLHFSDDNNTIFHSYPNSAALEKDKKNSIVLKIASLFLCGIFYSCRTPDNNSSGGKSSGGKSSGNKGSSTSVSGVIFDFNLIHAGPDGQDKIGVGTSNYQIYTYNEWLGTFNLNIHGLHTDPSLDVNFMPDSAADPVVNSGLDLSQYFTTDILGNSRPSGINWDMGSFEY